MSISSHASRWLVAAIAAPILLYIILLAPPVYLILVIMAVGIIAWHEFFRVVYGPGGRILLLLGFAGWLAVSSGAALFGPNGQMAGLVLAMAAGILYFLFSFEQVPGLIEQLGRYSIGHLYLSLFFSFFISLVLLPNGRVWVLYVLLVTFISDTSAYYAGHFFGRRPLYPAVSPKKTIEGLMGGLLGGAIVGAVAAVFLPAHWWQTALLGLLLGCWGALGDLVESMFKRSFGVKDSGTILMGHGGIWDRIDAITFNVPLVYFFVLILSEG